MKKYMFFIFVTYAVAVLACAGPVISVDSLARKQRVVLDVSHHQGNIDFEQVAQSPVKWIYLKATEGSTHVDSKFLEYARDAKAVEMKVGAYHYFSERSSASVQAAHFVNMIRQIDIDLLPMVDVEVQKLYTPDQLRDSLQVFLDCVEKEFGCKPMIYSGEKFFTRNLLPFGKSYPVWLAKYSKEAPDVDVDVMLWQSSESGLLNGIAGKVDVNTFLNNHRPHDIKLPSKRSSTKDDVKKKSYKSNNKDKDSRKNKLDK